MKTLVLVLFLIALTCGLGGLEFSRVMTSSDVQAVTHVVWPAASLTLSTESSGFYPTWHSQVRVLLAPWAVQEFLAKHPQLTPCDGGARCASGSVSGDGFMTTWSVRWSPQSSVLEETVDYAN